MNRRRFRSGLFVSILIVAVSCANISSALVLDIFWDVNDTDDDDFGSYDVYASFCGIPVYMGRISWEWMVTYAGNFSTYDFYAVRIDFNMTPSYVQGGSGIMNSGWLKIRHNNLYQYPAGWEPDTGPGPELRFGISVGISGFNLTFYTVPDILFSVSPDVCWGGSVKWSFTYNTFWAQTHQANFHLTELIRVQQGYGLDLSIETSTYWTVPHLLGASQVYWPLISYMFSI